MARYFSDSDFDRERFQTQRIGVIGYGNQGHAHAQNLRESGLEVRVGLRDASPSRAKAEADGFEVWSNPEVVRWADIVMMCTPDIPMGEIYRSCVEENLRPGQTLLFAHGFNIHYGLVKPPEHVNVAMVSPKGQGHGLRKLYVAGEGLPALVAVQQDVDGLALDAALGYAWGLGCFRAVVLETTFGEECEADMFGEQAVLCGGISQLIRAGYDTLVEAGYQPEIAYFETLHETKLIIDLIYAGGIAHMHKSISDTAEWGSYVSGPAVIDERTRETMRAILGRIRSGDFAREFVEEKRSGGARLAEYRKADAEHPSEAVGEDLRALMPFLKGS